MQLAIVTQRATPKNLALAEGGWVVLELNGAVEFSEEYSLGRDPFVAAALELARIALGCPHGPSPGTPNPLWDAATLSVRAAA